MIKDDNGNIYETLLDAIDAVEDGDTISIIDDQKV